MIYVSSNDVTADLLAKFNYFDSYRKQWEDQAIDNYKLYRAWKDARSEGLSNLHIPKTYEIIDTIRARLVKAFFGARPYLDFIPMPSASGNLQTLQINEEKAKVASALVDMQLEKNNITIKWYEFVTDLLIFPCAIMGVGWRYEVADVRTRVSEPEIVYDPYYGYVMTGRSIDRMVTSPQVVWDDNELVNIDWFDFWPDPKGRDIDSCRAVFHREVCTREELERKLSYLAQIREGTLYPVNLDALQGVTIVEDGKWERMNMVGYSSQDQEIYLYGNNEKDTKNVRFELLHYWEDDRHAILINRAECVYDGPNPYWRHRKKPFIVEGYEPLPGEFYALSGVEIISDLQHELNSQHNQVMDNVNMLINRMWKRRRGADIDDNQLVSRPNGVVDLDNMDDLQPLITGDMVNSAFITLQSNENQIESTLGTPPLVRGSAGGERTATEAMAKNTNASIRFDVKMLLLENMGVKRLAKIMDMNNQQFISEQRLVNMSEGDSVQWRMVNPDEICGEFDYRPAGTAVDPAANKEVRREQLTNMMTFLMQTQNPYIDLYELTREWIQSFDIRNPQKFLIPQEVIQQQQMLQQMMMQGMAGGGPPGAGPQVPNMPQAAVSNQMQGVRRVAG